MDRTFCYKHVDIDLSFKCNFVGAPSGSRQFILWQLQQQVFFQYLLGCIDFPVFAIAWDGLYYLMLWVVDDDICYQILIGKVAWWDSICLTEWKVPFRD